jgi:hypothetical protein
MILSRNTPAATSPFVPGQRVAYITGGGRSYRLATVVGSNGTQTRVTIRLDSADGASKLMRVQPWNLKELVEAPNA